ncbi:MAG: NAD(P)H-dependent oxidoreductase [Solobacterium sp.]|nr:NAD(P)H-dependent oxidoreductase [Solobacterium sp.]
MKRLLVIDCVMREGSRTRQLLDAFLLGVDRRIYEIETVKLNEIPLSPLMGVSYRERDELLANHDMNHPRFDLAKQFRDADAIVIAAPYWDMSFPSLLKIYFENICVDGITFESTEQGLAGLCHADPLVLLTTRGGFTETGSEDDQATSYIKALSRLLGFRNPATIGASGMDVWGYDWQKALKDACNLAHAFAASLK